jgi:hypothetical protein
MPFCRLMAESPKYVEIFCHLICFLDMFALTEFCDQFVSKPTALCWHYFHITVEEPKFSLLRKYRVDSDRNGNTLSSSVAICGRPVPLTVHQAQLAWPIFGGRDPSLWAKLCHMCPWSLVWRGQKCLFLHKSLHLRGKKMVCTPFVDPIYSDNCHCGLGKMNGCSIVPRTAKHCLKLFPFNSSLYFVSFSTVAWFLLSFTWHIFRHIVLTPLTSMLTDPSPVDAIL